MQQEKVKRMDTQRLVTPDDTPDITPKSTSEDLKTGAAQAKTNTAGTNNSYFQWFKNTNQNVAR